MLRRVLTWVVLWIAGLPLPAALACVDVASIWHQENGRYLRERGEIPVADYTIVASNRMLRTLNNEVFNGWTRGSEYVTNLVHFMVQHAMRAELATLPSLELVHVKSPYITRQEVAMNIRSGEAQQLLGLVDRAKQRALGDMIDYLFKDSARVADLVSSIEGPTSTLAKTGEYQFAEGRTHLIRLTATDKARLRTELKKAFATPEQLRQALRDNYGVGIGGSSWDAQFAARLAVKQGREHGLAVMFDHRNLVRVLRAANRQVDQMRWALPFENHNALIEVLNTFRAHREATPNPSTWSKQMRDVFAKMPDRGLTPSAKAARFLREARQLVETLNLLDYLPEHWVRVDSQARDRFDAFERPLGTMFVDVRGLGAKSLAATTRIVGPMLERVEQIELLIQEREAIRSSASKAELKQLDERISERFDNLVEMRTKFLSASNRLLVEFKAEMRAELARLGFGEKDYAMWASGDDILIHFGRIQRGGKQMDMQTVAEAFAKNQQIGGNGRLAYRRNVEGELTVPLDVARVRVAPAGDVIKGVEKLDLGYEVLGEVSTQGNRMVLTLSRLSPDRSQRLPIPAQHRLAIGELSSFYQVDWGP